MAFLGYNNVDWNELLKAYKPGVDKLKERVQSWQITTPVCRDVRHHKTGANDKLPPVKQSADSSESMKGRGFWPYDPTSVPIRPWTPLASPESDENPLKRFTDYKEIRELVKQQQAEIEHLRKIVDSLLEIIKIIKED